MSDPSRGTSLISPTRTSSSRSRCTIWSLVRPSGTVSLCWTTLWDARRVSMSFMLTPALNSYSPRLNELRLPSSRVRTLNHIALSMTPARSSWSAMLPPSSSRTMLTILSAASGPAFLESIISHAIAPTATSAPIRTKVRRPLRLESVERRGFFGSFRPGSLPGGGATLNGGAGSRARPKKLARRLPLPSPALLSPLMLAAGLRLMPPPVITRRTRARLDTSVARSATRANSI